MRHDAGGEAGELVERLGLKPHPEGGYFCETYRSALSVTAREISRPALTSIYYLLTRESFSAFHRIASDEIWHHYLGGTVAIESIDPSGTHRRALIGREDRHQAAIPAGTWFAAHPCDGAEYALVGCDVAPGFDFEDFELGSRANLCGEFPHHRDLIERWTRPA
ncbi:MAG TPA: cupin domain-containing protein [Candidatus Tumulicola sp.]|jgi:hypothetical protein